MSWEAGNGEFDEAGNGEFDEEYDQPVEPDWDLLNDAKKEQAIEDAQYGQGVSMNNQWRENRATGWTKDVGYALQDVLSSHHYDINSKGSKPDDPGWHPCSCGEWEGYWSAFEPHVADHLRTAVKAQEETRTLTGPLPDGQEWVLVTIWPDGGGELAFKAPGDRTWGPASTLQEEKD